MAIVEANFFSQSLLRTTTIHAIIPCDKMYFDNRGIEIRKFKTLYLLHGIFGNYTDWVTGTRIQRWAQDHNLAVIMPSGENKFYVDNPASLDLGSAYIKELVDVTRAMFQLSDKREDTFIAGLSMGGFGALVNGLKYSDTFSHIAGLSSGLLNDTFDSLTDDAESPISRRSFIESVFGPIEKIPGSDKDYHALAKNLAESGSELPEIFISCGTEDELLPCSVIFAKELKDLGYKVKETYSPGGHDWDFWDQSIYDVLQWLPIDEKEEALSSGNIRKKAE